MSDDRAASSRAVFKVVIKGTLDQVWRELTKTHEPQQAMFNARMDTPGLAPFGPARTKSERWPFDAVRVELPAA